MYYHLIIQLKGNNDKNRTVYLFDQQKIEIVKDLGRKFNQGIPFYVDGYRIIADSVNRFKIVQTDLPASAIANKKREVYRRVGFIAPITNGSALEDSEYSKDITTSILEETKEDQYVTNGTLHLDKLIKDEIKKESSSKPQITVYGNYINGNVENSQVVSSNGTFSYDEIKKILEEVKMTMKTESLNEAQTVEASEIVSDIEESVQQNKKPSVIKNALKGLKNLLVEFGASVSAKLIEDKCNGLW